MQLMFLMYHYFAEKEVYNAIWIYIACYVFMTGFGNFSLYVKGSRLRRRWGARGSWGTFEPPPPTTTTKVPNDLPSRSGECSLD